MKLLVLALALFSFATASAKTFSSADGSKKVSAEFVSYNAKKKSVTLKLQSGRNMTTAASNFSEEDQAYFVEAQKTVDLGRSIKVTVKKGDESRADRVAGIYTFKTESIPMSFEIKNSSDSKFEDLKLSYTVLVNRDREGGDEIDIIKGSERIQSIAGRDSTTVSGPELALDLGCSTDESCPKCQAHAASFGRDSLIGTRVEVTDSSGRVLYSKSSSSRVDKMIREKIVDGLDD